MATLVATVCLAAQAFALAHLFLVVHTRCAEHGEVIHEDAHATPRTSQAAPAGDLTTWDDAAPADSHDGADHHCETFAERRDVRTDRPVDPSVLVVVAATPTPLLLEARAPARPLYRLAPKVSPPHAEA